jgi:hypothetical protein
LASNYRINIDVEEKIKTSIRPDTKIMNDIKLSDTHLRVINRALEVYSRLRSGQIGIALDETYDKLIDYDSRDLIEKMVRKLIIDDKDLSNSGGNYSFNNSKMGDAKIAYEIRSVFRQYLAVKNNDGYFDFSTVDFNDPLKASEEPLPEIVNFVKYIDHLFTPEQSEKINQLHNKKEYKKAWDYIDSLELDVPRGDRVELVSGFNGVTMRIHKPRKEKRYL